MKRFLVTTIRLGVFFALWPVAWYVSRAVEPKRFRHLLMGLCIPLFGYLFNNFNYEMGVYLCVKVGWLFCNDHPPTRPELIAWRNMYGVPLFIGFSLNITNKFMVYLMKANRRLRPALRAARPGVMKSWKRRLWWL